MDYSKLSDFQINMAVHGCLGLDLHDCTEVAGSLTKIRSTGGHCVDYCNSPADAWPIISANRISVEYDSEDQCDVPAEWVTAYGIDDLKVHIVAHQPCDKALRSAMIVFLMMQESSNVPANPARPDIR